MVAPEKIVVLKHCQRRVPSSKKIPPSNAQYLGQMPRSPGDPVGPVGPVLPSAPAGPCSPTGPEIPLGP